MQVRISGYTDGDLPAAKEKKPLGRSQTLAVPVVIFMGFPSVLAGLTFCMTSS